MNNKILKYTNKGYKKIEGWYSRDALEIISAINNIQVHHDISGSLCEIGVHHGRSLVLLALLSKENERCLGIDLFENQNQNIDESGCGNKDIVQLNLRLNDCDIDRVKLISSNSLNLTPNDLLAISGNKFRFFSLDGGHSANVVQNDLKLAESVLEDGGVVLVDDYFDEKWPGVSEGTLKHLLLGESELIPFSMFDDKILFTNNFENKSIYIEKLRTLMPKFIVKEIEFLDQNCLIIYSSPSSIKNYLRRTKFWQLIKTSQSGKKIRSALK